MKTTNKRISKFRHELKLKFRRLLSKLPKHVGPKKGPMFFNEVFPGENGYLHKAIDFYADHGSPVLSSADGIVQKTEYDNGSKTGGTSITICHQFDVITSYHHLNTIAVKEKQKVQRGQIIGTVGVTGRRGPHDPSPPKVPHLHFAMAIKGKYVDPDKHIIDCFNINKVYQDRDHTYPIPCNSKGTSLKS